MRNSIRTKLYCQALQVPVNKLHFYLIKVATQLVHFTVKGSFRCGKWLKRMKSINPRLPTLETRQILLKNLKNSCKILFVTYTVTKDTQK